jgi:hypothetical protein
VTAPEARPSPQRARPPGPEIIGAVLAVVILALLATSAFAVNPGPPVASGSPRPTSSAVVAAATPSPLVEPRAVALLGALNKRLAALGEGLERELARTELRTNEVASLVRQVNTTVGHGAGTVRGLDGVDGENEPGGKLGALYKSMGDSATETLRASLANDADYRVGAILLVDYIADIPALQAELEVLAEAPPPAPSSAPPSVSPSAPPPATSAPPASSAPPPSVSPSPASAPPSAVPGSPEPSPAPDEQIDNGGFEGGVGPPWALFLGPGITATLQPETVAPAAGTTAAMVDLGLPSPAYSGVSLRQPGVHVDGGRQYTLSLWVRAEAARAIRISIASSTGGSYFLRTVPVTTTWTQVVFPFTVSASDLNASLEIDLGRSDVTTWVDTVSFRPATVR